MDEAEIRLRIVEKIHRFDQSAESNLIVAKIYETYVLGPQAAPAPEAQRATGKKSSTNPKQSGSERQSE